MIVTKGALLCPFDRVTEPGSTSKAGLLYGQSMRNTGARAPPTSTSASLSDRFTNSWVTSRLGSGNEYTSNRENKHSVSQPPTAGSQNHASHRHILPRGPELPLPDTNRSTTAV